MRDAVGGTFMIKLLLIFLAVYTIFIAVALNYAKAFRVKNKILNIIEQSEGINSYNDVSQGAAIGQINKYMNDVHYRINTGSIEKKCIGYEYINTDRGYCITKIENIDKNAEYYKVTTFVTIDFPVINLSFTIPIQGETRKIERINT